MTEPESSTARPGRRRAEPADRWWTLPNGLCLIRLVGSFALISLAIYGQRPAFLITFFALALTDWADGKIARWFDQRSRIGPRLDSVADITMYAAVLIGTYWMFSEAVFAERFFIGAALATYAVSCVASLVKFRSWPSYHTRAAKISWAFAIAAVISLFLGWSVWPLRVAALVVTLANLEAALITIVLPRRREDVPSLIHVLRQKMTSASLLAL